MALAKAAPVQMRKRSRETAQPGERLTHAISGTKESVGIKHLHANTGTYVSSVEARIQESHVLARRTLLPNWHHSRRCLRYLGIRAIYPPNANIKPP